MTESILNKKNNNTWYFLNTDISSSQFNMACDSYLFNCLIEGKILKPILRVYGWEELTMSLGLSQNLNNHNLPYPIVKRITGGQAVLHGLPNDEITYSICIKYDKGFKKLYCEIGEALIFFLRNYDLIANFGHKDKNYIENFDCFNSKTSADIVINDIKVIGSAQRRVQVNNDWYILQQGSVRLDKIKMLSTKLANLNFKEAALDLKISFEKFFEIRFVDYNLMSEDYEKIQSNNLLVV